MARDNVYLKAYQYFERKDEPDCGKYKKLLVAETWEHKVKLHRDIPIVDAARQVRLLHDETRQTENGGYPRAHNAMPSSASALRVV